MGGCQIGGRILYSLFLEPRRLESTNIVSFVNTLYSTAALAESNKLDGAREFLTSMQAKLQEEIATNELEAKNENERIKKEKDKDLAAQKEQEELDLANRRK